MQLLAPIQGIVVPLERVPDPVFAQKIVGDGVGIDPTSNVVVSPCDGTISHLHPARHAITIKAINGVEILIHIGIDTVELKGEGFRALVKTGDKVTANQPLIEFDQDKVAAKAKSLITLLLVANSQGQPIRVIPHDRATAGRDVLIEIANGKSASMIDPAVSGKSLKQIVRVPFATGLHARPAAQLAQLAKAFQSNLALHKDQRQANAKSVVSIMSLEASHNDQIEISASGSDAASALEALIKFFGSEDSTKKPTKIAAQPARKRSSDRVLGGIGISSHTVLGQVHILNSTTLDLPTKPTGSPTEELQKIEGAILEAKDQLNELVKKTKSQGLVSESEIFTAHQEILDDPEILTEARTRIQQNQSAAHAWNQAVQKQAQSLSLLQNDLLAQRAVDLRDVGRRVLQVLVPDLVGEQNIPDNSVVVADSITPSDVASFDLSRVVGFCSVTGNATSHASILARSIGIPAIVGIDPLVLELKEGTEVLLDAEGGTLNTHPSKAEIESALNRQREFKAREAEALKRAMEPAQTPEGKRIEVHANISGFEDAKKAVERGAEGVGLLRTEFLFLEKSTPPSEDEQLSVYQKIADVLGERPLTIRTLDVGGDKPPAFLELPAEENPFLGLRGIRISLLYPELFRTQIRAILRVKSKGPINIMFPMITTLEEFHQAKEIVRHEMRTHPNPNIHLGVMVEVPSVALTANAFAREVEFFSIGTNDLTQYTLAMDRGNPNLRVDSFHPSVFSLIQMTVEAAHRHNRWVGVCGDLAGQDKAIHKLVSIGVDELSVTPPAIPLVKAKVRERASL